MLCTTIVIVIFRTAVRTPEVASLNTAVPSLRTNLDIVWPSAIITIRAWINFLHKCYSLVSDFGPHHMANEKVRALFVHLMGQGWHGIEHMKAG